MRRGARRPKLKNSSILLILFVLLNIDVGALLLFGKYPSLFEKKAEKTVELEPVQDVPETVEVVVEEPVQEAANIIDVDIVVAEPDPSSEEEPVDDATTEEPGGDMDEQEAPETPGLLPKKIPANFMLADLSNFRQDERGWAYDPLGHTNQTMREFGCTVTSVANAITNYDRDFVTPRILNQNLIKARGFTDRGWLKWSAISTATDGKYSARVFGSASNANVDSCLANNEYPVVKIFLRGEVQHWVLIVGKRNGEYMIRDPLEGDRAEHPIPLSDRAKGIHSLRCIRRN